MPQLTQRARAERETKRGSADSVRTRGEGDQAVRQPTQRARAGRETKLRLSLLSAHAQEGSQSGPRQIPCA